MMENSERLEKIIMPTNEALKLIAADAKFQQNEQLKRKLIKLAHEVDLAKWARLNEGVNHERC